MNPSDKELVLSLQVLDCEPDVGVEANGVTTIITTLARIVSTMSNHCSSISIGCS